MLVDTHSHIYLDEFAADRDDVIRRATDHGVDMILLPNIDQMSVAPMNALHNQYPGCTEMAIGLHPTELTDAPAEEQLRFVIDELNSGRRYVGIGEIGIDLYWDTSLEQRQMEVFDMQMRMAAERNLPVIIHCREGLDQVLEVIDGLEKVPHGVFHSFGGTVDDVERIRRRGDFMFGIGGIVTFKNSRLREVLPAIGLDRIVVETDAPYLAPVPHRGKRNEPSYVVDTAGHIAHTLGVTFDEVAEATTKTAKSLFNF